MMTDIRYVFVILCLLFSSCDQAGVEKYVSVEFNIQRVITSRMAESIGMYEIYVGIQMDDGNIKIKRDNVWLDANSDGQPDSFSWVDKLPLNTPTSITVYWFELFPNNESSNFLLYLVKQRRRVEITETEGDSIVINEDRDEFPLFETTGSVPPDKIIVLDADDTPSSIILRPCNSSVLDSRCSGDYDGDFGSNIRERLCGTEPLIYTLGYQTSISPEGAPAPTEPVTVYDQLKCQDDNI